MSRSPFRWSAAADPAVAAAGALAIVAALVLTLQGPAATAFVATLPIAVGLGGATLMRRARAARRPQAPGRRVSDTTLVAARRRERLRTAYAVRVGDRAHAMARAGLIQESEAARLALEAFLSRPLGAMTTILGTEIEHARDLLAVEQACFDDRLIVDIFCSPDAALVPVPTGLLEPLIVRAVDLGVARCPDRMVVSLFARMTGRTLRLVLRSEMARGLDDDGEAALRDAAEALQEVHGARASLSVERVGHYNAVAIMIDDGLRPR